MSWVHVVGSLMVDRVLRVPSLPRPGETVVATGVATHAGGKGANQAAAAARAGSRVRMAGRTGPDGVFVIEALRAAGVDVSGIRTDDPASGNAVVMVGADGANSIVIAPEANARLEDADVRSFLSSVSPGEVVLFQQECAALDAGLAEAGFRRGRAWLNAAPADAARGLRGLDGLDGLVVNEAEARALTGEPDPARALRALAAKLPRTTVVVTVGAEGVLASAGGASIRMPAFAVRAVDTVGCGDAFVGYLVSVIARGSDLPEALRIASAAGAITATRPGALPAIPDAPEVQDFLRTQDSASGGVAPVLGS